MEKLEIQQRLLGLVQDRIPDKYSLVFELSELLGISNDSIYRRLRGETLLDINEIQKICQHYSLSFDSIIGCDQTGLVSFRFKPIREISDFKYWIAVITEALMNASRKKGVYVIYAAIDIPIFHNFRFPLVSFFKTLYWLKSIARHPDYQDFRYSVNNVNPEFIAAGKAMHELYCSIPSIEVWTDLITYSLLRQIEFYWDSGEFASRDDALALCDEVEREFHYMHEAARSSSKTPGKPGIPGEPVNFRVYDCDIEIATNCIMSVDGDQKTVFISTQTFNFIETSNSSFTEETFRWVNSLIRKSTLISDVGEK